MSMNSGSTYESIEERRVEAAQRYKSCRAAIQQQQVVAAHAEHALRDQNQRVEALKEAYAALSYLAKTLPAAPSSAEVYVQGAQTLAAYYPTTPFWRTEADKLVLGMQRSVQQQEDMAQNTKEQLAVMTEHLAQAEQPIPALTALLTQAQAELLHLRQQSEEAKRHWELLLHAKSWTRVKW
mmetsp:Transcript_5302/g.9175  ORF Transcript_5302/g.9175 Transcript_5302/m.9175 type:complete len:181 (+) Transcript_5302:74-616(+)